MKEKIYRLSEPFQGEKNLLQVEFNNQIVELPFIPQVYFPLQMALFSKIGPVPKALFVACEEDLLRANKASTIKVKITHLDFDQGLLLIKNAIEKTDAKIRIDANRTLSVDQVKILASLIPQERLDFFEEPTSTIEKVLELNIPLALDESFLEEGWQTRLAYKQVVAAVVKPYRVFYEPIYELTKKLGKRFVLSSSLEDSTPILKLATYLNLYSESVGIDVDRFKIEVMACPIKKANPCSIAIITSTEKITYHELDQRINSQGVEPGEILCNLPKLDALIKFFALLRQGQPISFNQPQKGIKAKSLHTIPKDTQIILVSSGTTGSPKEITWCWDQLFTNIQDQYLCYPPLKGASYRANLSLSRIGGLMAGLRPLLSGGALVLDDQVVTDFENMVPTQIIKKMAQNGSWHCRNLLIGGAFCPPYLIERLQQKSVKSVIIYTTSELGTCLIDNHLVANAKGCVHNGQFKIQKLGVCQNLRPGVDGFFETHDLAIDKEGKFTITGRKDRVINSGGEKISLDYIEKVASQIFEKTLFFAFGMHDPYWGEALALAFLGSEKSHTIQFHLKNNLPYYMVPKIVFMLPHDAPEKPPLSYLQNEAKKLMIPNTV